ncbi:low temperature requirement protein A [Micromonospora sp. DR5-3]|uniref:low temperature requirement protein A n=1 Tax=unclassified Micromonospora TaxID=2617518 RepID=UPI001CA318B4|nr:MULTISPECIES: low temperature requirement protein A [unclassified Micromonospora]MCW3814611.1 low temperature requirement protein A [Micromonospora sp. DR5-3]
MGFVELFFDVVFVFAFTRFSERLVENFTWPNTWTTLLLILAMWWLWYRTVWTTNRYDADRPAIQLMVIVTMLGTLLMSAAVPAAALTERGVVFAGVYVTLQVLRQLWLLRLGDKDGYPRLVNIRILFWAAMSAVPWIAGTFVQDGPRLALWTVALLIDYGGGILDFPTPRLGRAGLRGQPIAEEHLTERCRQLLIIALGEAVLASGIQFSPYGFQRDRTVALLVSFLITVLLWQLYHYRAGALLKAAIASASAPARIGELAAYAHLVMVIGVSLSAVGDTLIITHPSGHTKWTWVVVIFGGPALFLLGRSMLDYVVFSRVSWSRPIGVLLLAALAPAALRLPPVVVAMVAALVLAGIALSNVVAWRLAPRALAPPGIVR